MAKGRLYLSTDRPNLKESKVQSQASGRSKDSNKEKERGKKGVRNNFVKNKYIKV